MDFRNKKPSKYLWMDLEMTGLDVTRERIIEAAAIITDTSLNFISEYHCVIQQPQKILEAMDDWNKEHHKSSGLLDLIPQGKKQDQVEEELINWVQEYYEEGTPYSCG